MFYQCLDNLFNISSNAIRPALVNEFKSSIILTSVKDYLIDVAIRICPIERAVLLKGRIGRLFFAEYYQLFSGTYKCLDSAHSLWKKIPPIMGVWPAKPNCTGGKFLKKKVNGVFSSLNNLQLYPGWHFKSKLPHS